MTSDITKDQTINAIRSARELLDTVSTNTVAMRHALKVTHETVHEQAARIAELEKVNASMHDRLTVMSDARSHGAEITPRQADWMVNILGKHDDCVPNTLDVVGDPELGKSRMAEAFADLILDTRSDVMPSFVRNRLLSPNLAQKMKKAQMDRMENVCRLANAARHHIEHKRYAIADALLVPLAQGVHDAYKEDWIPDHGVQRI